MSDLTGNHKDRFSGDVAHIFTGEGSSSEDADQGPFQLQFLPSIDFCKFVL